MKNLLSRLVFLYNLLFFSRLVFLFTLLALQSPVLWAQDPGCFQIRIGEALNAQVGDTVCLPVTVSPIEGIASSQFAIVYDSLALNCLKVKLDSSDLTGISPLNFNIVNAGLIRFAWFDQAAMGINLPDGGLLFEACFVVKQVAGPGLHTIEIKPDVLPIYETVQFLLPDWNWNMLPFNHQPGGVWVDSVFGGALFDLSACSTIDSCGNQTGSIVLSVSGNTPPYSFSWSGPYGFVSDDSSAIYGLAAGDYSVIVTDGSGNSRHMNIRVEASNQNIKVNTNITPATCGQPTGCVQVLQPSNNYTYTWSNGSVGPEVCDLVPGFVYLTVTNNESGCTKAFYYYVGNNETGGYMFISNSGIQTCGGTGSAKVIYTPQNGLTFQFLWSTGDTTAEITGLNSGDYYCTVSVGNSCERVLSTSIPDYSTNTWNLKLISICDPVTGQGNFVLEHNPNANNLTFPLLMTWGDGTTRLIPSPTGNKYLDTLVNVPFGKYTATLTTSEGCSRSTTAVLNCTPPPPLPDNLPFFYVKDEYLNPQYLTDSCAGVYADHFNGFTELSFSLDYSGVTQFREIRNLSLPGLDMGMFTFDQQNSSIGVEWQSPGGVPVYLPNHSLLFEVCLVNGSSYASMYFGNVPVQAHLIDSTGEENAFMGIEGYVLLGLYFPPEKAFCSGGVIKGDCNLDQHSRILVEPCHPDSSLGFYNVRHNNLAVPKDYLLFADSGTYTFSVQYPVGPSYASNVFVYIPESGDADDCVWPGDLDNNNAVNQYDLLYLGLAYGAQGGLRSGANLDWSGQSSANWPLNTELRHVNYKNIDGNGDGVLNANDTLAILQNWGRVIDVSQDNPFNMPLVDSGFYNLPPISFPNDTFQPGQQIYLPLSIGTPESPVDSLYGMAFSISYDPAIIDPESVVFYPDDSWFGNPDSNLLWIQRNFKEFGRLDVAITRTDCQAVSGSGIIGDMFIVIEDNIFLQSGGDPERGSADTLKKTMLFFSGLGALESGEKAGGLSGAPVELVVVKKTSAVSEGLLPSDAVRIRPNPASDVVTVDSKAGRMERMECIDQHGRVRLSQASLNAHTIQLSVETLPSGVYMLRTYTEAGVALNRLMIIR
jgi:hypothetical protein